MFKKVIAGTLALTAIGTFIFGRDVFSYVRAGFSTTRAAIRSEVPLEIEIERAKQEVAQLLPEVRKSMHRIAEEQVNVANLRTSLERREIALGEQEEAILALTADLKSGNTQFVYAGHRYTQNDVQKDLTERFNRFKVAEDTFQREQQLLAAKEQALTQHRTTLEEMLSAKKTLEVEIERLEARLQTIDSRKQIHSLDIDDSQLNRARTLISKIEKRLDVEDAVLAAEGDFNGLIPVELKTQPEVDIAMQVEEYFGTTSPVEAVTY